MKSRNNQTPAIRVSAHSLASLAVFVKAFNYAYTAQEDERNRFPYTAALEWSHAAELFGTTTPAADYCWRQWERIMQLPRRLAGPIELKAPAAVPAVRVDRNHLQLQREALPIFLGGRLAIDQSPNKCGRRSVQRRGQSKS